MEENPDWKERFKTSGKRIWVKKKWGKVCLYWRGYENVTSRSWSIKREESRLKVQWSLQIWLFLAIFPSFLCVQWKGMVFFGWFLGWRDVENVEKLIKTYKNNPDRLGDVTDITSLREKGMEQKNHRLNTRKLMQRKCSMPSIRAITNTQKCYDCRTVNYHQIWVIWGKISK